MGALFVLFAFSAFLLLYTVLIYPLLLELLPLKPKAIQAPLELPRISVLVSVYNEEHHIRQRIRNLLNVEYPDHLVEILIGSDGSTDGTVPMALSVWAPRVKVFAFPSRAGKPLVIKRLVAEAQGEILVFTEANVRFERDTLEKLIRHFGNPEVGGVCGRLQLMGASEAEEGPYWSIENRLKWRESLLDSCLGADGGIYAIRKSAFPDIPENLLVDDFVIPMRVREQGLKVIYDREALASEDFPSTVRQEMVRRIRIAAGDFQALFLCRRLLSPRFGAFAFAFWSHKVLRWSAPLIMTLLFFSNALLVGDPLFAGIFWGQLAFYLLALSGCVLEHRGLWAIPHHFVVLNVALLMGFFKYLLKDQPIPWQ